MRESALALADLADRTEPRGPLHGVPFTIKESLDCIGSATTLGVPAFAGRVPYEDAPGVARMKAAGAIPLGRTNLSEMGLRLCTDNPLHGRTRNPWDPVLTVGGSSGGDAAAVATGMTPFGLGNDLGGSLRVPAFCCGIAALKPTPGRIPHASALDPQDGGMAMQAMFTNGPMARSVADLRLGLRVLSGRDVRDPRSVDVPLEGPEPDERRAALVTRLPGITLPASTVAAIERAGALLAAAGWEVEHAVPPELVRVCDLFGQWLAADLQVLVPMVAPIVSPTLQAHLRRLLAHGGQVPITTNRLHSERARLIRAWSRFLSRYPVAIGPNWTCPIWPCDTDLDPETGIRRIDDMARFTLPGSVLGLPSLALPMGLVDGLPTGIQIYADLWREDLCLTAGEIIEAGVGPMVPTDPV